MKLILIALLTLGVQTLNFANAAELTIKTEEKTLTFTTEELLQHPELKWITIKKDPAYGDSSRMYKAISLTTLFRDLKVPRDSLLIFTCLDGFSGPIQVARALETNPKKSLAFIAIEDPKVKWDALNPAKSKDSAGPFYLVWNDPKLSGITREEWPFQLSGFEVKPSLRQTYPKLFPKQLIAEGHPANRGLQTFVRQCFACHKMNGEGTSSVGPDLNLPMNPTRYFQTAALKKYIRDPKSVRNWPGQTMVGFDEKQISEKELNELITYLSLMAR